MQIGTMDVSAANYAGTAKTAKQETRRTDTASISQTTQEYISSLEKKYGVKISLVEFTKETQADAYIFGSSGGSNLALSAGIAEKMATDQAVAAKYEKVIAEVPDSTKKMKAGIAALGGENLACGVAIDKDGKVSYWSVSRYRRDRKPETNHKKALQEQLEEKRAKKKEEEALREKRLARAESVEKLMEKLRAEAPVKAKEEGKGTQLDLNI